jgi:deoxycytidylate deaminase
VYYPSFVREVAMNNDQPFHLAAWTKRGSSFVYGVNSGECSARFRRKYRDGQMGYHLHAEMALLKKCKEGDVDIIHVIRFSKDGKVTMAKPCPYCQKFLRQYGVKKVYYTNWEGKWEVLKL